MTLVLGEAEADERYFELFKLALDKLASPQLSHSDWGVIAKEAALALLPRASLLGIDGLVGSKVVSSATAPAAGVSFAGWNETALQGVLLAAMQWVTVRSFDAAPEAIANVRAEVDKALEALLVSRRGGQS